MDEDSDWMNTDEIKKQQPKRQQGGRGRNGRGQQQQVKKQLKKQRQQLKPETIDEMNCSWLSLKDQKREDSGIKKVRGSKLSDERNGTSFMTDNITDMTLPTGELKAEDMNTSWRMEQKKQTKNNQDAPVERGNRGNRNTRNNQQPEFNNRNDDRGFKKRPTYQQRGDNEKQERDNFGQFRGGRGRGRGRGRGNYNNFNDRQYNREGQQGQQKERGNRGNRDFRNNNGDNRQWKQKSDNQYNNGRRNNDRRDFNNDRYQNKFQNKNNLEKQEAQIPVYQAKVEPKVEKQQPEVVKKGKVVIIPAPKGRKSWPEASIHILKCKFMITYRQMHEFASKLLVIPYNTIKMQYYGGNIINSSTIDYKKKLISKGDQISRAGCIYLQKAIQVSSFEGLAFLKIDLNKVEESLRVGIKQVLKIAEKVEKECFDSIVFPVCQLLGNPQYIIRPFLQNLQNCRKIRQIFITTNQPKTYISVVRQFNNQLQKLMNENQIYID